MKRAGTFQALLLGVLFLILIFLAACSNQDNKEEKKSGSAKPIKGGVYRVPLWNNPITLDPGLVQDIYGIALIHQIFDGLVKYDSYLSVLPALAETWQVKENGKLYRFILRENARFHNQELVTAEDVVFSIKRLLKVEPGPAVLPHLLKITGAKEFRDGLKENVPGLKIESNQIIQIQLEEPYVPFLTALGMYQAAIIPKKEAIRLGDEFGKHPIGSGPFRFVKWNENKIIKLRRFEEYYEEPAFLEEIHYKFYLGRQYSLALDDFEQGKIEEIDVFGDGRVKLSQIQDIQWFHRPSLSHFFYGINVNHPNLNNKDFRKALSYAIDRKEFVRQAYADQFQVAKTILPPGMPGYNPLNQMETNNPELANFYFERYKQTTEADLPEVEIASAYKTPRIEKEIDMMKDFWGKLGVKIKVKYITDWKNYETYLRSDSVQLYRYSWFAVMPDPDSFLYPLFASESPSNFMKFKDDNIDQMLRIARGIVDPIERAKQYQKIEVRIMDSAPLIPLFYLTVDRVYQPYVKSVEVSALGAYYMTLNKIWMDKSVE
ncbi:MAG: ABC transporter substrate-binding protein [Desulfobacteraceae bacterium]|nr:ABC transporter substrate-binding protein [Desulfobacteraceae bacterium]